MLEQAFSLLNQVNSLFADREQELEKVRSVTATLSTVVLGGFAAPISQV